MDDRILCKVIKNSLKSRVFECQDGEMYFAYKVYGVNLSPVKTLSHPTLIFNVDIISFEVGEEIVNESLSPMSRNKLIRSLILEELKSLLMFYNISHHISHVINVGRIRWSIPSCPL